jgi:hypothetical protein
MMREHQALHPQPYGLRKSYEPPHRSAGRCR